MDINFNITGRNEHVLSIEWIIRTIKERVWAIAIQLHFETYPHRLIVEKVCNIMFWINCMGSMT